MNKLKKAHQIHGKLETTEPSTLDEIWGSVSNNKYSTLKDDEYEAELKGMIKADLQRHSVEIANLVPTDDRDLLTRRLLKEFRKYVGSLQKKPKITSKNSDKEIIGKKDVMRILAEGR